MQCLDDRTLHISVPVAIGAKDAFHNLTSGSILRRLGWSNRHSTGCRILVPDIEGMSARVCLQELGFKSQVTRGLVALVMLLSIFSKVLFNSASTG
jgi:hypothetical protein